MECLFHFFLDCLDHGRLLEDLPAPGRLCVIDNVRLIQRILEGLAAMDLLKDETQHPFLDDVNTHFLEKMLNCIHKLRKTFWHSCSSP